MTPSRSGEAVSAAPAAAGANPARPPRWRNPEKSLPLVRAGVQGAYTGFLLLVGYEFATWVSQLLAGAPRTATRPPAVEAFLPISALLGLKRFVLTGQWDDIHPAGLTLLVAALVSALLARRAFCSWVCPVGGVSRALEWVGERLLWRRRWPRVPRWLDLPLSGLKYVLLAFFVSAIVAMPLQGVESFMRAPFNAASDARMLMFFKHPSALTLGVLAGLVGLSLVVKHAWCRWLCPYGALLGLASLPSPLHVRRDPAVCNDCGACNRACPVEIPVARRLRVLSPECTGCLSCVAACPVKDALGVTRPGPRALPGWVVPVTVLAVMLGSYAVARATGHWETALPEPYLRRVYVMMGVR